MPKFNWVLSSLLVTAMMFSGLPTGSTQTTKSWENIFSKDEDNEPPVPPASGGGTSRGGFICASAPRSIGTITEVWSDRPLFVWQGVVGQIEVRKPATKETLWRQTVSAATSRVSYGGEPLQPGQTYHWVIFDQGNRSIVEIPFQVMESQKRDRIKTRLQILDVELKENELGKYLIEKYTILTAPSIQVLQLTHQERQRVESIHELPLQDALVVGNPTMPSVPPAPGEKPQPLPSLPGAEQEVLAIAPLLKTKAIIGKDATKTAIVQLMPKARIIHLATHGLLDEIQGIGSAIALAPDPPSPLSKGGQEGGDGLLTAEEILNLKLNADLVVLSACNTGRGRITGDGVIGLSRSLISAGVPSVIVSLWSVPDAPTAELMTQFYQNLQKNPDKAQALRQAMLTTMKEHANPKEWAAFTLIGEAN
jgi:hypothetical protein